MPGIRMRAFVMCASGRFKKQQNKFTIDNIVVNVYTTRYVRVCCGLDQIITAIKLCHCRQLHSLICKIIYIMNVYKPNVAIVVVVRYITVFGGAHQQYYALRYIHNILYYNILHGRCTYPSRLLRGFLGR